MKTPIILLALAFLFSACTPTGMNFYRPVTVKNADGTTGTKSVKVASFAADFVGLKRFAFNAQTGDCVIEFQEGLLVEEQYAVQDKSGKLVGTLTRHTAPGIYVARVIDAYGEAGRKIVDAFSAGVTGALLSGTTPIALGNGLSAIPLK